MAGIVRPDDLHKITDDIETVKVKEALAKKRSQDDDMGKLREEFSSRDLHPDVADRLSASLKKAAAAGLRELKVLEFPAAYCTDKGRAINNFEESWPDSLQGFAKRAHEYFVKELQPQGFKLRAQIMNYPDGGLGDVGIFLAW